MCLKMPTHLLHVRERLSPLERHDARFQAGVQRRITAAEDNGHHYCRVKVIGLPSKEFNQYFEGLDYN
jgi:hypothetical protein